MNFSGIFFGFYVFLSIIFYQWLAVKLYNILQDKGWLLFNGLFVICLVFAFLSATNSTALFWGYHAGLNLWAIKIYRQPRHGQKHWW